MEKIVPLTVCPNHCEDIFFVNAESLRNMLREEDSNVNLSKLEVDPFGDPLDFTMRGRGWIQTMDTSDMDEIETGYPQLRLFAKYQHVETLISCFFL